MGFTDIRADGLVGRLPESWRPYAYLMRLDRPIGWWLLLLPGWWAMAMAAGGLNGFSGYQWYLFVLFFIGAVAMRGAGCIVNDLWDRDLDAKVERTKSRPLASGVIKPWQASVQLVLLCFLGLIILVQTSALAFWLGMLSVLFVVAYPYMKRITWWPQAFLGITFNFGVLIGWAAFTSAIEVPALLLYAGAFFWTLGYDTIYAHQDKDDDALVGIKSTALLFGSRSKAWVGGFFLLAWCLMALASYFAGAGVISLGLLILPGVHMLFQILLWKINDPASCLRVFKSNRDCGLLFLLSFLALTF